MIDRLTEHQRKVMESIDAGMVLCVLPNGEAWLHNRDIEPVELVNTRTADRLVIRGLVRGSGVLTLKGRQVLAMARGDYQVPMVCGDCRQEIKVQRATYLDCRRNESGICCPDCARKLFVPRAYPAPSEAGAATEEE